MSTILIASLDPAQGRTTATAALGALLAEQKRAVRLLRVRAGTGAAAAAEDDARTLASAPGCTAPKGAASEQDALTQANEAGASGGLCLVEAPPGPPAELAGRLGARVVLVTAAADEAAMSDVAAAAQALGDALLGVVALRQPDGGGSAFEARGLRLLALLPEDRLLAGPSVRELASALHASPLYEDGEQDEALEYVMLGPISADPGQPYFLRHPHKAVINRFDKMDLHLAALATEPECLVLTGGQQPSPYLMDRVQGSGLELTVLLAPEGTVRSMAALEELYGRTRFAGRRKLERAIGLFRQHGDIDALTKLIS